MIENFKEKTQHFFRRKKTGKISACHLAKQKFSTSRKHLLCREKLDLFDPRSDGSPDRLFYILCVTEARSKQFDDPVY